MQNEFEGFYARFGPKNHRFALLSYLYSSTSSYFLAAFLHAILLQTYHLL